MTQPEFVRLDGQAVRVTSFMRDEASGRIELVIVARGSAAALVLGEIGSKPNVIMEIPDQAANRYIIVATDFRASGEGEQAMNRVRFTLEPQTEQETQVDEPETQLDRIERKLDELLVRAGAGTNGTDS